MFMTLRRLAPMVRRATSNEATGQDLERCANAMALRTRERGPSKLARRMRRKSQLGMAGAF